MSRLTIEESDNLDVRPDDVHRLIDATQVVDVRLDEVHAGPVGALTDSMLITVDVDEPQIGRTEDPDRVLVRLTHRVTCSPEEGSDAATHLQLSHVVALDVVSELTTRWPVVAAWIETNLYFLVYPYVRQTVSTLTTSLGMPSIVLNYLDRDARPLTQRTSEAAHG